MATGNEAYDIVSDEEIASSVEAVSALSDDVKQLQPQISNSGMSPGVKWCYKTTGVIVIFLVVMLAGMVTYVALRDDDVNNKDTVADKTTTTTKKPDPTVPPGDNVDGSRDILFLATARANNKYEVQGQIELEKEGHTQGQTDRQKVQTDTTDDKAERHIELKDLTLADSSQKQLLSQLSSSLPLQHRTLQQRA